MKKEIIICDLCSKDAERVENFVEATKKCELCGKDVCEDCSFNFEIGNEDGGIEILSLRCCENCEGEIQLDKKEDKKVIKEVRGILLNHIKKRVLAKKSKIKKNGL